MVSVPFTADATCSEASFTSTRWLHERVGSSSRHPHAGNMPRSDDL
jgi:hypothetical protein